MHLYMVHTLFPAQPLWLVSLIALHLLSAFLLVKLHAPFYYLQFHWPVKSTPPFLKHIYISKTAGSASAEVARTLTHSELKLKFGL